MNEIPAPQIPMVGTLSIEIAPFVADRAASIVVASVVSRDAVVIGDAEEGSLSLKLDEVLQSQTLMPGQTIRVPFRRIATPDNRFYGRRDQWNNLNLDPGALLLLACAHQWADPTLRPGSSPTGPPLCTPLGAIGIRSSEDPVVVEARRAVEIEYHVPPQQQASALQEALIAGKSILREYAIDAALNREKVPRMKAVQMLGAAISSPATSSNDKLTLGVALGGSDPFVDAPQTDPANILRVSILTRAMVAERNPDQRMNWINVLSSRVMRGFSDDPAEDQAARTSLIRAVRDPEPGQVIAALESQAALGSDSQKQFVQRLQNAWRQATGL